MSLYAGLDVGTQSVKLVAYDPDTRQVVATTGHPLDLAAGDDGSREQRAEWWLEAIRASFAALDPGVRARIRAIGVSGQQHRSETGRAAGTDSGQRTRAWVRGG